MRSLESLRKTPIQRYRHNVDRFLDAVNTGQNETATHYAIEARLPTNPLFVAQRLPDGSDSEMSFQSFAGYDVYLPESDDPIFRMQRDIIRLNEKQERALAIADQLYYQVQTALGPLLNPPKQKEQGKGRQFSYILQPGRGNPEAYRHSVAQMMLQRVTHLRALYTEVIYSLAVRREVDVREAQKVRKEMFMEYHRAENLS